MDLTTFSEENFLSTLILYLNTSAYGDNEEVTCDFVLFNLFKLYRKASKIDNMGTFEQIENIKNLPADSTERLKSEKSKLYVGYKILWAVRMLLNGRMFPTGNIEDKRWYMTIHQIMECITQKGMMLDLLTIDCEAYF